MTALHAPGCACSADSIGRGARTELASLPGYVTCPSCGKSVWQTGGKLRWHKASRGAGLPRCKGSGVNVHTSQAASPESAVERILTTLKPALELIEGLAASFEETDSDVCHVERDEVEEAVESIRRARGGS